jgi:serine/threonine-protein kinase RsbW
VSDAGAHDTTYCEKAAKCPYDEVQDGVMTDAGSQRPRSVAPADVSPLLAERFDRSQVTGLRHSLASCVEAAGLRGQRLDDFVLAVNELITNAVRHGGGAGQLRLWVTSEMVLCEVSDDGGGIGPERLANHDRPAPDTAGGWGLWLAEQLSDAMTVTSGAAGTVVSIGAMLDPSTAMRESVE